MHYCGLDVSRKSTHVYIEDAQGRRVTRGVVATTPKLLTIAFPLLRDGTTYDPRRLRCPV